ncbi:unnamed protein product [Moneuplotes crassus]|uniref:Uncharacterized protein n=1 Tax=Euplotes crassus TaxID=5936 RepID=A0AAD1X8G4_EUPCR|nr:unnamed protein product [Moneuplotes crassus]
MENQEEISKEQFVNPINCAVSAVDEIVQKGADTLYDKYLQSILPAHELNIVTESLRHVLRSNFIARDHGEHWHDDEDQEATQPVVCRWANGEIPVDTRIVIKVPEEPESLNLIKTATKSMSSYIKKKMKLLSSKQKSFKEFKPKIEHIDETDSMIPQLRKAREKEKELGVINPAFPHLNMEGQIDRLRKKVEKDAKRKKIESDIKKKKKKVNITNMATENINLDRNKPFTTNDEGHPIIIKAVNKNRLPHNDVSTSTKVNLDSSSVEYGKIDHLKHLYGVPAGHHIPPPSFENPHPLDTDDDGNMQEITALQPPPSQVLTLKSGVLLNENGNILNGPEADHKSRMTKEMYQTTLGNQSMQRKKFHEQRFREKANLNSSPQTGHNNSTGRINLKYGSTGKFSLKKGYKKMLKRRIDNITGSAQKDTVLINQSNTSWKDEIIIQDSRNLKTTDSKFSINMNESFVSLHGERYNTQISNRSLSQKSFKEALEKKRPGTVEEAYQIPKIKMKSGMPLLGIKRPRNRNFSTKSKDHNSSYDRVRNYKSKHFNDTNPVYGAIDAFNRTVLKNAHDVATSGSGSKKIAVRPTSNQYTSTSTVGFYPSINKGPKDRANGLKNILVFRNTFSNKFQL